DIAGSVQAETIDHNYLVRPTQAVQRSPDIRSFIVGQDQHRDLIQQGGCFLRLFREGQAAVYSHRFRSSLTGFSATTTIDFHKKGTLPAPQKRRFLNPTSASNW